MTETIHLIYPHGSQISTPAAIGRNLGKRLSAYYRVKYYDWDSTQTINPNSGDILLGHPHPFPGTIFRKSLMKSGWKRKIIMCPYAHGDIKQSAYIDRLISRSDLFLAITGIYWFHSVEKSPFLHWHPKMIHLDLAINRVDFPIIKKHFNKPGKRKFLYIGHTNRFKNTRYISELAEKLEDGQLNWIGCGKSIKNVQALGYYQFSSAEAKELISQHDFLITVGNSDANPTTILEAMSWGLVPVCTPQSGYVDYPGIINVPLGDAKKAIEILNNLQYLPNAELHSFQKTNWDVLDTHFNWERFSKQVINAIQSGESPALGRLSFFHKLRLRWAEVRSPYSPLHPRNWYSKVRLLFRRA